MKYFSKFILVLVLIFVSSGYIYSQEKVKTHKVEAGESVRSISSKYQITPYDLIKVNPDLEEPLTPGNIIVIPVLKKDVSGVLVEAKDRDTKQPEVVNPTFHIVKAKETIFSLSKKYKIHIDDLFDYNPSLVNGLKIGMKLSIPPQIVVQSEVIQRDTAKFTMHIIKPKETRWGICHKYSITEEELINNNPIVVQKMNIGDTLWLPKKKVAFVEPKENINFNYTYYEVKPKDTTYGISKKFNITIDELREDNPVIVSEGLKIGMVLKIAKSPTRIYDSSKVEIITLTNLPNDSKLSNAEKLNELDKLEFPKVVDVVLMLPFYLNKNGELINDITKGKISNKDIHSNEEEDLFYRKSKIALEFYNGALFAIDSLKKMGLSVRLRVFDTEKDLEVVKRIMAENDFSDVDVVIGPLYTDNVEYVADKLKYDNILVVSPLSKKLEIDNRFNLVQAMPTSYTTKNSVLNQVIQEKNDSTSIIVFGGSIDSLSVKFIKTRLNAKLDTNIVTSYIAHDNVVDRDEVFKLLDSKKDNVILIDSDSNILATDVITALNQVSDSLPNRAYLISHPKILKQLEGSYLNTVSLAYPSDYYVSTESPEVKKFNKDFKTKNSYLPTMFSYRGFDITYEILLSLGRSSNLEVGILHESRRGLQGKFEFVREPFGGYFNKGVFMLRYNDWKLEDISN